jgi:hypothetical protein
VIIIFSSFEELPSDDTDCVDVAASCNDDDNFPINHSFFKKLYMFVNTHPSNNVTAFLFSSDLFSVKL